MHAHLRACTACLERQGCRLLLLLARPCCCSHRWCCCCGALRLPCRQCRSRLCWLHVHAGRLRLHQLLLLLHANTLQRSCGMQATLQSSIPKEEVDTPC